MRKEEVMRGLESPTRACLSPRLCTPLCCVPPPPSFFFTTRPLTWPSHRRSAHMKAGIDAEVFHAARVKYEREAELTRADGAAAASGSSALEMSHAGTSSGPPVFGANQ